MADLEKVLRGLKCCLHVKDCNCGDCPYDDIDLRCKSENLYNDVMELLKAQENLKQKMWNALYAEEDRLEKKFIGTEEHGDWFTVYRPWLQRGFEIAIKVIAEQDGR